MTDTPLRERVAKAMRDVYLARQPKYSGAEGYPLEEFLPEADAAIALMRPVMRAQALEEAADAVGEIGDHADVGAYINAICDLKEKPNE